MVERYDAEMRKHLRESFLATEKKTLRQGENRKRAAAPSIYSINRSCGSWWFGFLKSIYERFEKCQWRDFLRLLVPINRKNSFYIFFVHLVVHFKRFEAKDKVQGRCKNKYFSPRAGLPPCLSLLIGRLRLFFHHYQVNNKISCSRDRKESEDVYKRRI